MRNRPLKIGIIDSGINISRINRKSYIGGVNIGVKDDSILPFGDGLDSARNGHGTTCARIIHKISPGSHIYSIKVLNSKNKCSVRAIAGGIQWAMEQKLDILNISIAANNHALLDVLKPVCREAYRKNILIVAAKENNVTSPSYPADLDTVIAVDYRIIRDPRKSLNIFRFNHALISLRASIKEAIHEKSTWVWLNVLSNSYMTACITGSIAQNMWKQQVTDIRVIHKDLNKFI